MAEEKKAATSQNPVNQANSAKQPVESVYRVQELVEADVFGVKRECVAAALKETKKEKMTLAEARKKVNEFMKREVK